MSEDNERKDINTIQKENLELLQKSIVENDQEIHSCNYKWISETEVVSESSVDLVWQEILEPVFFEEIEVEEANEKNIDTKKIVEKNSISKKIISSIWFFCRYIATAWFIFVILMAFTNYSAYITIAKSYLNPEAIAKSEAKINKSMEVSKIVSNNEKVLGIQEKMVAENIDEKTEEPDTLERKDIQVKKDIRDIVWDLKSEEINLDIEIIPFINRVVIPKIAKNIPLVDIEQGNVENFDELNGIFMDELKWIWKQKIRVSYCRLLVLNRTMGFNRR